MNNISNRALPSDNLLLSALPADEYQRLFPKLEEFALNYGEEIFRQNDVIKYVYFPKSGIISLLTSVDEHSTIEVGLIGREGIVGLSVFLGVATSDNRAIVQGSGLAMRITAADFLGECRDRGSLTTILHRFAQSRLSQVSQSAACYRFHQIEARLARWLLMTSDRMESDDFDITQEFLSNMLGVRREAVNKSSGVLQKKNFITHSRGKISIVDRSGLETAACVCYAAIKNESQSFPVSFAS
ncbi:MAG: Crp/Fnr family transcriptional regulator [Acidobacteria bacterium]|nr:Crp/Fnr family transcriptional regulator [Acidobacteriota bacterium]